MSLPNLNLSNVRADMDQAINAVGNDADFVLRDGTSFTITCARRTRTGIDSTPGLVVDRLEIQIPYTAWDARSPGRPPQKGDRVTMLGRTSALDDPRQVGAGNIIFGWVCRTIG